MSEGGVSQTARAQGLVWSIRSTEVGEKQIRVTYRVSEYIGTFKTFNVSLLWASNLLNFSAMRVASRGDRTEIEVPLSRKTGSLIHD